jgi:predicted LPLAT superfamily acyltransferase
MGSIIKKEKGMKQVTDNKDNEKKTSQNKRYGNKLGYSIFHFVLRHIGLSGAYGILFLLIPYYVLLRPSVYRCAKPYLRRRFPEDTFLKRYIRLFKYIFIFGQALIDQLYFGFVGESKIKLKFDREPEILDLLNKKPVIFLLSHVGFWEVSMAGSIRFRKQMNVLVDKNFDKDKRKSFYDVRKNGEGPRFNLINVSDSYGGMIEATNALLRGEVVGVTGDRAEEWRTKTVPFLGSPAKFPIIAEQLAVTTGACVIALFTAKDDKQTIRYSWVDISTEVLDNKSLNKDQKIQRMLELYSAALENHIQKHPYLWFNFFDFWKI